MSVVDPVLFLALNTNCPYDPLRSNHQDIPAVAGFPPNVCPEIPLLVGKTKAIGYSSEERENGPADLVVPAATLANPVSSKTRISTGPI